MERDTRIGLFILGGLAIVGLVTAVTVLIVRTTDHPDGGDRVVAAILKCGAEGHELTGEIACTGVSCRMVIAADSTVVSRAYGDPVGSHREWKRAETRATCESNEGTYAGEWAANQRKQLTLKPPSGEPYMVEVPADTIVAVGDKWPR
jgi:hypothetical protein